MSSNHKTPPKLVQRLDTIRSICKGKSVLHLGCADSPYTDQAVANGTLLHADLAKTASELVGLDFEEESLAKLRSLGFDNLYQADLEALEKVDLNRTFDVIIAGEMIEHLNNPGLFLNGIRRFMSPETQLVITTVNSYCGMRFFHYALTKGGGINEPVHPDHVAYYSYGTLRKLVERHGLEVSDFYFYDLGREHRKTARWILRVFNDISVAFARQLADGVIAVCRLA
jgi:cyclopropane fatty-acyl-phospholipid synthase-like methyltransferase